LRSGLAVLALLQNAKSLLPAIKDLSFREMQSLFPLLHTLEAKDVDALVRNMPAIKPHMHALIPALPALMPHFRLVMEDLPVLVPKMDKLVPLIPRLTASKQTSDCLPYLLERRVLTGLEFFFCCC
jgi:hypothetical protein